jgi:hypothetical protein
VVCKVVHHSRVAAAGIAAALGKGMSSTAIPTLSTDQLLTVIGGAAATSTMPSAGGVCKPGVEYNSNGSPKQYLSNPTPGAIEHENTVKGVEKYNNFYERYTGLIDNLNGIGGGGAVAGGAKPGPELGF